MMLNPAQPRMLFYGLVLCLSLVIAPHLPHLPLWLSGLTMALLVWRVWMIKHQQKLPHKAIMLLLAVAGIAGVLFEYKTLLGREAGVALLTLMSVMKLLETQREREVWLVVFLGYFLMLTQFLFDQSMLMGLYLLCVAWLFTTLLIGFSQPKAQLPWKRQFMLSARMLLQAVPLMLLLFFLFPRISGPLWSLPSDTGTGKTGLSDTMTPGMISQLAQSDSVAFRVNFEGALPPTAKRYFRVLVMEGFDGTSWRALRPRAFEGEMEARGPGLRYTVTLEAHNKPWLPVLDYADPKSLPLGSRLNSDFTAVQREAVKQRKRYGASAYLQLQVLDNDTEGLQRALELPSRSNPRTREFATELRQSSRDNQDYLNKVLARFNRDNFVYTLSPPRLGANSIDQFLFDTKRGFCEHYASSFTFLMRAVGIPARVVTGYQSGEFNKFGNYLIVRQADAHAWSEVWLEGRGWVRVDPTAAVSPNRIEQGIANALPQGETLPLFLRTPSPWLQQLKFSWDALNNGWNQWVLGYDQENQVSFFARLGFGILSWQDLVWYLLIGIGGVFGLIALFTLRQRKVAGGKVERAYALFCQRLQKIGIERQPSEGPLDFAQRAKTLRPDLAQAIERITQRYVALRYGGQAKPEWIQELVHAAGQFHARRKQPQAT